MNELRTQAELLEQEKAIIEDYVFVYNKQLDSITDKIVGYSGYSQFDESVVQSLEKLYAYYEHKATDLREKIRKDSSELKLLVEKIHVLEVTLKKLLNKSAKKKYVLFTLCKQITSDFKVHIRIAS